MPTRFAGKHDSNAMMAFASKLVQAMSVPGATVGQALNSLKNEPLYRYIRQTGDNTVALK